MKKTLKSKLSFKKNVIQELTKKELMSVQGGAGVPSSVCSIAATQCVSCDNGPTGKNVCSVS